MASNLRVNSLGLIEWIDSATSIGWGKSSDSATPSYCRSVGWIIRKDKNFIVIAPHVDKDSGLVCGDMAIPIKAIIKTKVLASF